MFRQIASLFAAATTTLPADDRFGASPVAHNLLGQANARAGHDPAEARRLRAAASAYLSVIR